LPGPAWRRTVNLPLSIVKIRLWLPGRFVRSSSTEAFL
jgi:hypothetical protein